jgi:hypothetical protein
MTTPGRTLVLETTPRRVGHHGQRGRRATLAGMLAIAGCVATLAWGSWSASGPAHIAPANTPPGAASASLRFLEENADLGLGPAPVADAATLRFLEENTRLAAADR